VYGYGRKGADIAPNRMSLSALLNVLSSPVASRQAVDAQTR